MLLGFLLCFVLISLCLLGGLISAGAAFVPLVFEFVSLGCRLGCLVGWATCLCLGVLSLRLDLRCTC